MAMQIFAYIDLCQIKKEKGSGWVCLQTVAGPKLWSQAKAKTETWIIGLPSWVMNEIINASKITALVKNET